MGFVSLNFVGMFKGEKARNVIKKLFVGSVVLLIVWNTWTISQMGAIADRVDKYNQGVVDEVGKVTGNVKQFAEDLNDIRRFLLLPEKNYFNDEQNPPDTTSGEQTNSKNAQAAFAFLNSLEEEEKAAKNSALAQTAYDELLKNPDFQAKVTGAQLAFGEKGPMMMKFNDAQQNFGGTQQNVFFQQPLYNLVFDAQENAFKIQSALGEQSFKDYTAADFSNRLVDYFTQNTAAVREKKAAQKSEEANIAEKLKLDADAQLVNKKKELDGIVKDPAFTETLQAMGLKVSDEAREESNKYIFDVVDSAGKVHFSLAVELSSGMMKVIRDNKETDLQTFLETSDGSKKKP